jgi:hypothetical protein
MVPGLFGPNEGPDARTEALPEFPALQTLLAKGSVQNESSVGLEARLFSLFRVAVDAGEELPVAPVSWLAEAGIYPRAGWLRADPVCLQADRDRLILFDSGFLVIQQDEADAIVAEINRVLGGEGWSLHAPHPERWYLHLSDRPRLRTTPLCRVTGRDIRPYLPRGEDAMAWQGRLTEIQMLMHMHPVNQAREASEQLPINSLWFWGGGELPQVLPGSWTRVWSDEPLAKGLAALGGIACGAIPADAHDWLTQCESGQHLVVLDGTRCPAQQGDRQAWAAALARWDRLWFAPLVAALKQRRLSSLSLYSEAGVAYRVYARDLRRWWRLRRALAAFSKAR